MEVILGDLLKFKTRDEMDSERKLRADIKERIDRFGADRFEEVKANLKEAAKRLDW